MARLLEGEELSFVPQASDTAATNSWRARYPCNDELANDPLPVCDLNSSIAASLNAVCANEHMNGPDEQVGWHIPELYSTLDNPDVCTSLLELPKLFVKRLEIFE